MKPSDYSSAPSQVTDLLQIYFRAATPADVAFLERLRCITMYRSVTNHYVWNDEVQRERVMANYDSARIICASGQDIGLFKVCTVSLISVPIVPTQLLPHCSEPSGCLRANRQD